MDFTCHFYQRYTLEMFVSCIHTITNTFQFFRVEVSFSEQVVGVVLVLFDVATKVYHNH